MKGVHTEGITPWEGIAHGAEREYSQRGLHLEGITHDAEWE